MKYLSSSIFCLLITIILNSYTSSAEIAQVISDAFRDEDWTYFERLVDLAEMKGFFSTNQTITMIQEMFTKTEGTHYTTEQIGNTTEGHGIVVYCITDLNNKDKSFMPIALLTGAHHAREPLSVSMIVYLLLRILVEHKKGNPDYIDLLRNSYVCTIPIVNIDGYLYIEQLYKQTGGSFTEIRKNRRKNNCSPANQGVDLNRNYDFNWGSDNIGSSGNECDEDYRGPTPFSEPETEAIHKYVKGNKEKLQLAINFHAFRYGNLWIIPFNCCPNMQRPKRIAQIYDEFARSNTFPAQARVGNAKQTIDYLANGEASDWLTGKYGILSLSPELGVSTQASNAFFPPKNTIYNSLNSSEDFGPIWYMLSRMTPVLIYKNESNYQVDTHKISIQLQNKGYSRNEDIELRLKLNLDFDPQIKDEPGYPKIRFIQNDAATLEKLVEFDFPIPKIESIGNLTLYNFQTHITIHSWSLIEIEILLSDISYQSIGYEIRLGKGKREYFSHVHSLSGAQEISKTGYSTLIKLFIIITAIGIAILIGFGVANLIKNASSRRWPNNKTYEFKDLSAVDTSRAEENEI